MRRARATKLKAADARSLLQATLPYALAHMPESVVSEMQRVLDAAVVNPEVRKEAAALDKKAVIAESGGYQNIDPAKARLADDARKALVPVGENDQRVRIDYRTLLSEDSLTQRTDNPDEISYLNRVRNTLTSKGVWLRFTQKRVRDPEDPSMLVLDPRQFEAWLSIGPNGDTIPTKDGQLTRESLLGTTLFGAGYYEHVDIGPAQSALNREIRRLIGAIEMGIDQHDMLGRIRDDAFPGVAEAADLFGGASFPNTKVFDQAHKLVVRALEMNVGGNLTGSQAFLVMAGVVTRSAAQELKEYLDDTNSGVERIVPVLKVLKTAGQVAEAGLAVTGIVGLARGGMALAGGEATAGAFSSDIDVAANQLADRYAARSGIHADELKVIRTMKSPKGSVAGGVKPGTSSGAGQGFQKW